MIRKWSSLLADREKVWVVWREGQNSLKAGPVVMNSLSFCLFGKVFIPLAFLKDRFPGREFLVDSYFLVIF